MIKADMTKRVQNHHTTLLFEWRPKCEMRFIDVYPEGEYSQNIEVNKASE